MKTKVCEEARSSMSEEVMKIEADLDKRIVGLATKADLEIAVTRTQADISELKSDISNLETKMEAGMVKMAAGFQVATSELKSELLASNNTQFRWIAGMLVAIAAILVGLEFFSKVLPG